MTKKTYKIIDFCGVSGLLLSFSKLFGHSFDPEKYGRSDFVAEKASIAISANLWYALSDKHCVVR